MRNNKAFKADASKLIPAHSRRPTSGRPQLSSENAFVVFMMMEELRSSNARNSAISAFGKLTA